MSQPTFSHQFSKRWLNSPQAVRHAIVQELGDIATLLDPDTPLDDFEFSQPDLTQHIEKIYADLTNKDFDNDSTAPDVMLPKNANGEQKANSDKADDHIQSNTHNKPSQTHTAVTTKPLTTGLDADDSKAATVSDGALNNDANTTNVTKPADKSVADALIAELQQKIDDYLSEQMALMSEDLKAWLQEEVRNRTEPQVK